MKRSLLIGVFFLFWMGTITLPVHAQKSSPLVWSFEFSSWISTGKTQWNSDTTGASSIAGNPSSQLTYDDLDSHVLDFDVEMREPGNYFVRLNWGFGNITDGHLTDEDFFNDAARAGTPGTGDFTASKTQSEVDGSGLWYINADFGSPYMKIAGGGEVVRGFIGFQHIEETLTARGVTSVICTPEGSAQLGCQPVGTVSSQGTTVITNKATWNALRVGLEGYYDFTERIRWDVHGVVMPFVFLDNEDTHHLRSDLKQDPSFEMDGIGYGFNLETQLTIKLFEHLHLKAGYRYWFLKVTDGTFTTRPVSGAPINLTLNEFTTQRHGVLAALVLAF